MTDAESLLPPVTAPIGYDANLFGNINEYDRLVLAHEQISRAHQVDPESKDLRQLEAFIYAAWWARLYAYTVIFVLLFVMVVNHIAYPAAHVRWRMCQPNPPKVPSTMWGCIANYHFILGPPACFEAFTAVFTLVYLSPKNMESYKAILYTNNMMNLLLYYVTWDILQQSIIGSWPLYQSLIAVVEVFSTCAGVFFGFFVILVMNEAIKPTQPSTYEYPRSVAEIVSLVMRARSEGAQIRVRGSGHSALGAIYTDGKTNDINVSMQHYTKILRSWEENGKKLVRVQSGIHLGKDPRDPYSTWENSLTNHLHSKGWALPEYGGILHQTISGFLSTGSTGGNIKHPLEKHIYGIQFVDGTGKIHDVTRQTDEDLFNAVGCSMGLFGIITEVTIDCIEEFKVMGTEIVGGYDHDDVRFFSQEPHDEHDTRKGLREFFEETPYTRINWWPQTKVKKLTVWQAKQMTPNDEKEWDEAGNKFPEPFNNFPTCLGDVPEMFLKTFYSILRLQDEGSYQYSETTEDFVAFIINSFQTGTKTFADWSYKAIAMDNEVSDDYVPVLFTEMWFDIDDTERVIESLETYFEGDKGMDRTGPFTWEIYAAPKSEFWMSPSYGCNVVRVDVFANAFQDPDPQNGWFQQIWNWFDTQGIPYRAHWGKFMPRNSAQFLPQVWDKYRDEEGENVWNKWMEKRHEMDPDQIFVNTYWRTHLGIPPKR